MMSKKCKYALKAVIRLGENYGKGYMQTADIAEKENIPKKFLEQILLELKHARIVNSRQGSKGGYYLLKDPAEVSVAEVYRLFDGAIALLPCVAVQYYERCDDCQDEKTCVLRKEFTKIKEETREVMNKITIRSFLVKGKKKESTVEP